MISTDPEDFRQRQPTLHAARSVARHGLALLAAALLCGGLVYAIALQRPVLHEADSSLIFRFGKEYFPANAAISAWQGEPIRVFVDEAIHTEMEILGSRRVLKATLFRFPTEQRVADEIGIDEYAAERLSIRRIEGTYVVKVAYRHKRPGMAEGFIAMLLENFLLERQRLLGHDPSQTLIEAEAVARAELAQARAALAEATATAAPSGETQGSNPPPDAVRAALDMAVALTEESYRKIAELRAEYQLVAQIEAARGPVIEVLDSPSAEPNPVGIAPPVQAALSVLAALAGLASALFALVWLRIVLAQPKQAEDFLQSFLKSRAESQNQSNRPLEKAGLK
jgi:hypothetical protein